MTELVPPGYCEVVVLVNTGVFRRLFCNVSRFALCLLSQSHSFVQIEFGSLNYTVEEF